MMLISGLLSQWPKTAQGLCLPLGMCESAFIVHIVTAARTNLVISVT